MRLKLILIFIMVFGVVYASEFESPITYYKWHNTQCLLYANNFGVVLKNNSNFEVGEQTYIVRNSCILTKKDKPITKFKLTQFYLGKKGRQLFFDNGSSPDFRQLKIYDIYLRKFVFIDNYVDGLVFNQDTVEYWQEDLNNHDLSICTDRESMIANGLNPVIAHRVVINLNNLTSKNVYLTKPKCVYIQ